MIRIFYAFIADDNELLEGFNDHANMEEPKNFWRGYCEEQTVCQNFVNANDVPITDNSTGKVYRPIVQHWMKWR